jgi:outer membrane lipoprotein-sorting protein
MTLRTYLHLFLAILLAVCASAPAPAKQSAAGTPPEHAKTLIFTANGPLIDKTVDGADFIEKLHQHTSALKDYSCEFEIVVYKKDSTVVEKGILYFKQPRLMRLEEKGDYKKGAVVVLGANGKARGHLGGAMKYFTMTLEPDSSWLVASNSYPMKDSDLMSLSAFLKNWLVQGIKSRVTEEPVTIEEIGQPVHVLEMYKSSDPKTVLKRIYIDPQTHLPIRWDDHDYENPSRSKWKNLKTNIELSEDLFKL